MIASNLKLRYRSYNIPRRISTVCHSMDDAAIDALLQQCDGSVKLALLVAESGRPVAACRKRLEAAEGFLATALASEPRANGPGSCNGISQHSTYVLCVDGGGSKCAAAISRPDGTTGRGLGGPCNLFVTSARSRLVYAC